MKKLLLFSLASLLCTAAWAEKETIVTNGKTCTIDVLIDRDLGPGIHYTRLRLPEYPLNVNMLRIDVTNPYNSVETTQGSEKLYSTESLVTAAKRQSTTGHVALAGANANFWCVSGQPPYSDILVGLTYNGNLKNGKIISELNMHSDQWNGGYKHTGILGITPDRKVYSGNDWTWTSSIKSDKIGSLEVITVNKTVRDEEIGIYNSFYPTSRTFKCVNQYEGTDGKQHFETVTGVATELYLTLDAGQQWSAGNDMTFTVKEVKNNAGEGKIGSYDLAIVGRGSKATALANLVIGDKVTLNYAFVNPEGQPVVMNNLVGGNAQVMVNGEMTKYATSETYNSQVYSRTGYGCDADNKTLYIIVIDKSTDPVYGVSAGCSSTVMCDIARHFGCVNMTNFDAGGSAEMLVNGAIINKTTEGTPRAVANGMIAYSIAPEDNVITRLEFEDYILKAPVYGSYTPRILGYNQYGALVSEDVQGFTLSCPEEAGSCDGMTFTAAGKGVNSTITATLGDVTVTKPIEIVDAQMAIRIKPLLIDHVRKYPMEVSATVDGNVYTYNPASIDWEIADNSVVDIDATGTLTALKEGKTTVTARIGDFTDATEVTAEFAKAPINNLEETFTAADWKASGTGTKSWVITPVDNSYGCSVNFSISGTRGTALKLTKDVLLYSLPDGLQFTVNPGDLAVNDMTISVLPANESRPVDFKITTNFEANKDNVVDIDLKEFGDTSDLSFFPVTFRSISFSLGSKTGAYTMAIPTMKVKYNNFVSGVGNISVDNESDASAPGVYYNLQGVRMPEGSLAPGLYIRRQGSTSTKVIIR